MTTNKSIIKLAVFGLLAFAIAGTPMVSRAQTTPTGTDTTTNAVKTVKHKKKKTADTNAPAMTTPVAAPVSAPPPAVAATTATTTAPATPAGKSKSSVLPFHGKLKAVDAAGGTVSIGTRTFTITSETIIIKNGKPATLSDGVVGDETGGAYKKTADGKLVITKLRFGAKTADETTK